MTYTGNDRGNEGDAHQLVWEHMGTILPIGRFPIFYFQSLLMENNSARTQTSQKHFHRNLLDNDGSVDG